MSVSVDVRDLLRAPGTSRPVLLSAPLPDVGTEVARIPEDRPVEADLLMESVVEGILVGGPLSGSMTLTCARCLKPFEAPFDLRVEEMFAVGAGPQDDEYPVGDGFIDLEPMFRDAVMLAMPFAPLCRAECLGLCDRCGADRNLNECACPPEAAAGWAPLSSLALDLRSGPPRARG
jgi:uncharacterized protein